MPNQKKSNKKSAKLERKKFYTEEELFKQKLRFQAFKEYTGLTLEKLAEKLEYKNFEQIYKFYSGARQVSVRAADKIYHEYGWRSEYMRGIDDFKTDDDLFAAAKEYEEFEFIRAYNAIAHEVEGITGQNLQFKNEKNDVLLVYTDKDGAQTVIPFEDFRAAILNSALEMIQSNTAQNG